MKYFFKTIGDGLVALLLFLVCQFLSLSYRYRRIGGEHYATAKAAHPLGVFAIASWHEQLLAGVLSHSFRRYITMASLSRDGGLAANVLRFLGFAMTRGSSSRGGSSALAIMEEGMKAGHISCLTVDGPRGPRRVPKFGIFTLAQATKSMIVPLSTTSDRLWILRRSWDQFQIPKPFARVVISYGQPMSVGESVTREDFPKLTEELTRRINQAERDGIEYLNEKNL